MQNKQTATALSHHHTQEIAPIVTPFMIKGAAPLLAFMKKAFGAVELLHVPADGNIPGHAVTRIEQAVIILFDSPENWPSTPACLRLHVEDSDSLYEQALSAGALAVTTPMNTAWGDRVCRIQDPFGNLWWLITHIEDISVEEWRRRHKETNEHPVFKTGHYWPHPETTNN